MICDICKEDIELMDYEKMIRYKIRGMNICCFCSLKQKNNEDYMLLYKCLLQKQKLERKAFFHEWAKAKLV